MSDFFMGYSRVRLFVEHTSTIPIGILIPPTGQNYLPSVWVKG